MPGQPILREYERRVEAAGGADWLYEQIADGRTILAIAKDLDVSRPFLSKFANGDKERLKSAREEGASVHAEESLAIADEATPETERVSRLRIEVRRWLASKRDPASFGEQQRAGVTVNLSMLHLDALRQHAAAQRAKQELTAGVPAVDAGASTIGA